jgi:hypothetical protein
MRPKSFTVVGSAGGPTYSPAYPLDTFASPMSVGIGVVVSGPIAVADVQHTFTDPFAGTDLTRNVSAAVWENNATLVSATQAGANNGAYSTNYAFPCRAVRLRVRALASAGALERATITIIQSNPE